MNTRECLARICENWRADPDERLSYEDAIAIDQTAFMELAKAKMDGYFFANSDGRLGFKPRDMFSMVLLWTGNKWTPDYPA